MLYLNGQYKSAKWSIWKIEESEEQLLAMLDYKDWYQEILNHQSAQRRIEMLAVRVLLKKMLNKEILIQYLPSGRPYLKNGLNLSISHTLGYVAIAISSTSTVAIDIEQYTQKLYKVKSRFVLDTDLIDATCPLKHLTLYWCAKEAIYKYFDDSQIDLLHNVVLETFELRSNIGHFDILVKEKAPNTFEAFYVCDDKFSFVIIQ